MIKNVPAALAAEMLEKDKSIRLIDVREPWEFELVHPAGAENFPLSGLMKALESLPKEGTYLLLCHHGSRSLNACVYMSLQGYSQLYNVEGGVEAWALEVDTKLARY